MGHELVESEGSTGSVVIGSCWASAKASSSLYKPNWGPSSSILQLQKQQNKTTSQKGHAASSSMLSLGLLSVKPPCSPLFSD